MSYTVDLERRVTLMTSQRTRGVIPFDPPAYRLTAPEAGAAVSLMAVARTGAARRARWLATKYSRRNMSISCRRT